jgi:hypothetical protein
MSTPIEVLFHHSPNCSCEQCQKTVKPFRNGKFFSKEEIDQINNDMKSLIQENAKLQEIVDKFVAREEEREKTTAAKATPSPQQEDEEDADDKTAKPSRNITITIDTSNLIYIAIIAILVIMIIKK